MERTEWPTDYPRDPAQPDERLDTGRVQFRPEERQRERERRRGPKNYQRSDERIYEVLAERLMESAHLDSSDVTVTVRDAMVTLEGTVPERWMKHAIENVAITSWGVTDVENRVRVPRQRR
jgi:osmotically-inducible protein OsmY